MADELLGRQSAHAEAKALLKLLETGSTVQELRALIAVPPNIEQRLREFAQEFPQEGPAIEQILKF